MHTNEARVFTVSWLIWGAGYAVYYPFYPLFAERFVGQGGLGLLYAELAVFGMLFPILGAELGARIGPRGVIALGMASSGLGLALIPLAWNYPTFLAFSVTSYAFFIALPNFYSWMASLGEGTISTVWAASVLPMIIFPLVGGGVVQYLGFTFVFLVGGLLTALSGLVVLSQGDPSVEAGKYQRISPVPMACVVPIAMTFPYLTPTLNDLGLNYLAVGLLMSLAEFLGMVLSYSMPKLRTWGLVISLLIFSLVPLVYINVGFGVAFGAWEAVIPLSLEFAVFNKSLRGYAAVNSSQQFGWLLGFLTDSALRAPEQSLLLSSALSIALAFTVWLAFGRKGRRVTS